MPAFEVRVTIRNRPGMDDPEGRTILEDLVLRGGHSAVTAIRTAKVLIMTVEAADPGAALGEVRRMCEEMRIYNPVASTASFEA